jgi:peptide deformylase
MTQRLIARTVSTVVRISNMGLQNAARVSPCQRAHVHQRAACAVLGRKQRAKSQSRRDRNVIPCAKSKASRALQELLNRRNDEAEDGGDETEEGAYPTLSASVSDVADLSRPLSVLKYPDPVLRNPNYTVTVFDSSLKSLAEKMFEVMYEDDGVGLAAPQVGVNVRMMVFNETGERENVEDQVVLVNPRIVNTSGPKTVFEEGCLSFPAMYGDVVRPSRVRVKAQDLEGKSFFMNIDKFPARIFQHEFDHLQGVLFVDRMEDRVVGGLQEALRGLEDAFEKENPGVEVKKASGGAER